MAVRFFRFSPRLDATHTLLYTDVIVFRPTAASLIILMPSRLLVRRLGAAVISSYLSRLDSSIHRADHFLSCNLSKPLVASVRQ